MNYVINGKLYASICDNQRKPLAHTKIRVYALEEKENALAAFTSAQSKEVSKVYEEKDIKSRKSTLLAETTTDANGAYSITINGKKQKYNGSSL